MISLSFSDIGVIVSFIGGLVAQYLILHSKIVKLETRESMRHREISVIREDIKSFKDDMEKKMNELVKSNQTLTIALTKLETTLKLNENE